VLGLGLAYYAKFLRLLSVAGLRFTLFTHSPPGMPNRIRVRV